MQKKFKGNEKSLQVFIPPEMHRDFKIACAKKEVTIRDAILKYVADFIKK